MTTRKTITVLLPVLVLLAILAVSCAPAKDASTDVAVIVALTQTAAALQNPAPAVVPPTEPPATLKGYQPFNTDDCNALNNSLSSVYGFTGEVILPVQFEDYVNNTSGLGCQITFSRTGQYVNGLDTFMDPTTPFMQGLGWQQDGAYSAGGAGGMVLAYRKEATLCLTVFEIKEIDPMLCSGNEPVTACWSRLAPEQLKYSAIFNCATYYP